LLGQIVDETKTRDLTMITYICGAYGIIACGTTYFFPFDEKRSKSMAIRN